MALWRTVITALWRREGSYLCLQDSDRSCVGRGRDHSLLCSTAASEAHHHACNGAGIMQLLRVLLVTLAECSLT